MIDLSIRNLILSAICALLAVAANANDPATGIMEGHLKILSFKEVELAQGGTPEKVIGDNFGDYPLVIRSRGGHKEIARITAGPDGNYHAELPEGNYILDIAKRERKHARATARPFTVISNQTIRVDFEVDTGVR